MNAETPESPDDRSATIDVLTQHLETFISAWADSPPPNILEHLPTEEPHRKNVLIELIKFDLEFRWNEGYNPQYVEDYVRIFPELQAKAVPLDLIYEEFHIRKNAGLKVDSSEYTQRFPQHRESIKRLLDGGGSTQSLSLLNRDSQEFLDQLSAGQQFEDFDLILKLGEGSFAKVFLAKQRSMQRLVALKISADRGNEAETLSQFDHDYIVRVYDQRIIPEKGVRLLYMQYVSGGTLHDVVQHLKQHAPDNPRGNILFDAVDQQLRLRGEGRQGRSPWRQDLENAEWSNTVCWIGACLAEGLQHSHQQHVLHRDIKPANVLLTSEGIPKLADFNISYCSKVAGVSPATFFGGSLSYMSPEQLEACNPANPRDPADVDHRSDIYSLGIVLYELLVGQRPYSDVYDTDGSDLLAHMTLKRQRQDYAYPEKPTIPESVRETIDRCLFAAPRKRWQSAEQLQQRLKLCGNPKVRDYLFPSSKSLRQRVLPFSRLLMIVGFLLPNLLAAIFNFYYNEEKIIQPMSTQLGDEAGSVKQHFMVVQGVINLIAFPLGIYLNDLFIRKSLRAAREMPKEEAVSDWSTILNVGLRCALLALLMWVMAGLAYPISMSVQAIEISFQLYAHFFFSLLLCGLFAVALTYFDLTVYSLMILVPLAIKQGTRSDQMGVVLRRLMRRNWLFLLTSAIVPMLASVALAFLSDQTPWILGIISLGGMLAFGICLWHMSRIQMAARRLEAAFGDNPQACFQEHD